MEPLPSRMRPKSLDQFVGQEHLLSKDSSLYVQITSKQLQSMIFWGPPGVGKTTLAYLISKTVNVDFYSLNAINSGVKEIRDVIEKAKGKKKLTDESSILFIDEIHRFSKSQQDSLLKAVEDGVIILIGATTENPSFEVISALLSRCHLYTLKELSKKDLELILDNAVKLDPVLSSKNLKIQESSSLIKYSGGDARKLLSYLDLLSQKTQAITNKIVEESISDIASRYDKDGERHYDTISAYIKSIRGSDPQAALYYLGIMLHSGEDIKFIARRLVILAHEDIGLANSNAAILAQSVFDTITVLGMPEARIPLSHLTVYLATSPKSNSIYTAINDVLEFIKNNPNVEIPLNLRNSPTKLMKDLGYGAEYKYSHQYEGNFEFQEFLPDKFSNKVFYTPSKNPKEQKIKESQQKLWKNKYDFS